MKLCPRTGSGPCYGAFRQVAGENAVEVVVHPLFLRAAVGGDAKFTLFFHKIYGPMNGPSVFLGGTIFLCCWGHGENLKNCRRTPRQRIWRVCLVFGSLTGYSPFKHDFVWKTILYFWGWSLFRGQKLFTFRGGFTGKILQVSPCRFPRPPQPPGIPRDSLIRPGTFLFDLEKCCWEKHGEFGEASPWSGGISSAHF